MTQPGVEPTGACLARRAPELRAAHETFRFLTEEDHRLLGERARTLKFQPDEAILREGSARQGLFVIVSGRVRVEREHLGCHVASMIRYCSLSPMTL